MSRTFTNIDDAALCELIRSAKHRLVFVAPGLRPVVAHELEASMDRVPASMMQLVLDVDAEVSRLGYGDRDFKGMERLQQAAAKHGLQVHHHPGIRIGLLIADDTTIVYSPTPELIEAGSKQPDKPNGIQLGGVPAQLAVACALDGSPTNEAELSKKPIDAVKVAEVMKELKDRPPKEFNVARIERVFNSMLHYVELRIEDYKLTARSMRIDSTLFGVQTKEVMERLTNRYRLFAESETLTVEIPSFGPDGQPDPNGGKERFDARSIDHERTRLKRKFIIEAGKHGSLILRKNVKDFERELEVLRAKIEAFKQEVQKVVEKRADEIIAELIEALGERLRREPPDHWRSRFIGQEPTDLDVRRLFEDELRSEIQRVKSDFEPRIFTTYKDVTYQTFQDPEFKGILEKQFGKTAVTDIFREYDAAPEQQAVRMKGA
jgi:hypothetical protein